MNGKCELQNILNKNNKVLYTYKMCKIDKVNRHI